MVNKHKSNRLSYKVGRVVGNIIGWCVVTIILAVVIGITVFSVYAVWHTLSKFLG